MKKNIKVYFLISLICVLLIAIVIRIQSNLRRQMIISKKPEIVYCIDPDFYINQNDTNTINSDVIKLSGINNNNVRVKNTSDNNINIIKNDVNTVDTSESKNNNYSTNTLIIETTDEAIFQKYKSINNVEKINDDLYIVNFIDSEDGIKDYKMLQEDNSINNVIKDYKIYALDQTIPNTSISLAWGVEHTGIRNYALKLESEIKNTTVKIAVLDTGINPNHEIFSINGAGSKVDLTKSYNYVDKNSNVKDGNGHGTAVAGVIAESTSKNVKIVPLKIMNDKGEGNLSYLLEALKDIYPYVDIINLSIGLDSGVSERERTSLEKLFKEVYNSGRIVVCSAGNSQTKVSYPASSSYTLAASAIDSTNIFAYSFSNFGQEVDFALPGVNLNLPYYITNTSYKPYSGTSFSAPFLASAVALVKTEYPNFSYSGIIDVLKANADDLGKVGKDDLYGYGSINFNSTMFKEPAILDIAYNSNSWTTKKDIYVKAVGKNLKSYAITLDKEYPSNWTNFNAVSDYQECQISTRNNGYNYVWIKDFSNNVTCKEIKIKFVDNNVPLVKRLDVDVMSSYQVSADLLVEDTDSGISKIEWNYKKMSDSTYKTKEILKNNETTDIIEKYTLLNLDEKTEYILYAKIFDSSGNYTESNRIIFKTL